MPALRGHQPSPAPAVANSSFSEARARGGLEHDLGGAEKPVLGLRLSVLIDKLFRKKSDLGCVVVEPKSPRPSPRANLLADSTFGGRRQRRLPTLWRPFGGSGSHPPTLGGHSNLMAASLLAAIRSKKAAETPEPNQGGEKALRAGGRADALADFFLPLWQALQNRTKGALDMGKDEFRKRCEEEQAGEGIDWKETTGPFVRMLRELPLTYRNGPFFMRHVHNKLAGLDPTPRLQHLARGILEQYRGHASDFCAEPKMDEPTVTIGDQVEYFHRIVKQEKDNALQTASYTEDEREKITRGKPILPKYVYVPYAWFKRTLWDCLAHAPNVSGAQVLLRQGAYRKGMASREWLPEWGPLLLPRLRKKAEDVVQEKTRSDAAVKGDDRAPGLEQRRRRGGALEAVQGFL